MGFVFVGIGGAIGSMLRYGISLIPYKQTFPVLTLITNIIGAFLIGYISAFAAKKSLNPNTVLLLKTGLCGGFTTFSTFSLEAYTLMQNGQHTSAVVYILISVIGCLFGIWGGMALA